MQSKEFVSWPSNTVSWSMMHRPTGVARPPLPRILLRLLLRAGLRLGAVIRARVAAFAYGGFALFLLLVSFRRTDFFLGMRAVYH